ncbi:hypothetical protein MMC18_003670 [Xylographa bjoerkii]|nr:hypothetical protein [Xylographa bjoerkii]
MRRLAQGVMLRLLKEHSNGLTPTSPDYSTLGRLTKIDISKARILIQVLKEAKWLTLQTFMSWLEDMPGIVQQAERGILANATQRPQQHTTDGGDSSGTDFEGRDDEDNALSHYMTNKTLVLEHHRTLPIEALFSRHNSEDECTLINSTRPKPTKEVSAVYPPTRGESVFDTTPDSTTREAIRLDVVISSAAGNSNLSLATIDNAAKRFIRARGLPHGMLSGDIEREMTDIFHDSGCFAENLMTHAGWSSDKQLCFGSLDPSSLLRTLGCQLFAESEQVSWVQSANMMSTRSNNVLSTKSLPLGLLAAFTNNIIFNFDALPALRPTDTISQFIDNRMKSWGLYDFAEFYATRAARELFESPDFMKNAVQPQAMKLVYEFNSTIAPLQTLWNKTRKLSDSYDPLNHELNNAWNVEGMELFAKCLMFRNKLALDADRRKVYFSLPIGGAKFLPDQMYRVTDMIETAVSGQHSSNIVQMAQGPIVSLEEVSHHEAQADRNASRVRSKPSVIWKPPVLLL